MVPTAILPFLSLLKWPATLAGAVLVFGLSTEGTLSLVSSNAHKLTTPIAGRSLVNMPPTRQLASLSPFIVAEAGAAESLPVAEAKAMPIVAVLQLRSPVAAVESSGATVGSRPEQTMATSRIGGAAVNVRSGPSKNARKIDVLQAHALVRVAEKESGWLHVFYSDRDGWIYSTFLAR